MNVKVNDSMFWVAMVGFIASFLIAAFAGGLAIIAVLIMWFAAYTFGVMNEQHNEEMRRKFGAKYARDHKLLVEHYIGSDKE